MSGQGLELDPEQARWLLNELSRRLTERGVKGTIRVAGGAAMALNFPDDPEIRVTSDIDAVYKPKPEIDELIAEMAIEFNLPPRWLNSSGAAWLRVDEPAGEEAVGVSVASPLQLVAMKLAASREQDLYDLRILARHLKITDPDVLVEVAYREYGEDAVELPDGRDSYRLIAQAVLDTSRANRGAATKRPQRVRITDLPTTAQGSLQLKKDLADRFRKFPELASMSRTETDGDEPVDQDEPGR